ncbi:MAG: hypothetical protein JWR26_4459 [Pedosphaera sp.]|nr:hypothetical protein [Pedosphaera sp.]
MKKLFGSLWLVLCLALLSCVFSPRVCQAAGVTVITHGFESSASFPNWVSAMADKIPSVQQFSGTNFTTYRITLTYNSPNYFYSVTRTNGSAPFATDSGEIIVELDWSVISADVFHSYGSTLGVATVVNWVLTQTNIIPELEGHALAEFPLHLVGHSRGASLMAETSRQLGTNGIWVDQLTTLDPHPLNNDSHSDFPASVVDAPAKFTYANVLFADNYWQNLGAGYLFGDPDGEPVSGAYQRQLFNLSGGYNNDHSNVHLWYHGTVDLATPASDGSGGATITTAQRTSWWQTNEADGALTGFYYSLIDGGDRLSTAQPLGFGTSEIRDGFNQAWSLGAGTSSNRTALTSNNGSWPNLIRFNRINTNAVVQGQNASVTYYYQWASSTTNLATVSIYLDNDRNPLNTNQTLLKQINVPANGASFVSLQTLSIPFDATNASPGLHTLFAKITGGGQTRYLYAPESVQVLPGAQPPILAVLRPNGSQIQIVVNGLVGQKIILQSTTDLMNWVPVSTNTLTASPWIFPDSFSNANGRRFYRAALTN